MLLTSPLSSPLKNPLRDGFSPAGGPSLTAQVQALFAVGEQGVWYAPRDFSTMFQDVGGTIPVTATGQRVRKILDKSGRGNHASDANGLTLQIDSDGFYYLDSSGSTGLVSSAFAMGSDKLFLAVKVRPLSSSANMIVEFSAIADSNAGTFNFFRSGDAFYTSVNGSVAISSVFTAQRSLAETVVYTSNYDLAGTTKATEFLEPTTNGLPGLFFGVSGATDSGGGNFGTYSLYVARRGASSLPFVGRIYELIVRGASTSAKDVATVSSYLQGSKTPPIIAFVGDSLVAGQGAVRATAFQVDGVEPALIAVAGDTIAQQKIRYVARTDKSLFRAVIVEVGLNDLSPGEAASVAIARLQDLIDTIVASVSVPVYIAKMTPCFARLNTLYGGSGPTAYAKWLDMNVAITGAGPTPITNVSGRITAHEPLLNDGSGNLLATYDTGDGAHPTFAGRQIIADAWRTKLVADGFVT